MFQASTNGEDWENLCGERSKLGGVFQVYEEPLYDGKQTQWVSETTDLSNYLGQRIQLRFYIGTDGYVFRDGFYFDDFKVITVREETVAAEDPAASQILVYPNPSSGKFIFETPDADELTIAVYNSLGNRMYFEKSTRNTLHEVNSLQWPQGVYHYVICSGGEPIAQGTVGLMP